MPNTKGELFKDKKGEVRARVRGNNNRIIATTEGYKNKTGAVNALRLMGINKKAINDLRKNQLRKNNSMSEIKKYN